MQGLLPYIINGISAGGQYALIAIGYTLVYGILRLINFAHGDVFMVAGLIMVYASASMPMMMKNWQRRKHKWQRLRRLQPEKAMVMH